MDLEMACSSAPSFFLRTTELLEFHVFQSIPPRTCSYCTNAVDAHVQAMKKSDIETNVFHLNTKDAKA